LIMCSPRGWLTCTLTFPPVFPVCFSPFAQGGHPTVPIIGRNPMMPKVTRIGNIAYIFIL
jgi:hypothetical protein